MGKIKNWTLVKRIKTPRVQKKTALAVTAWTHDNSPAEVEVISTPDDPQGNFKVAYQPTDKQGNVLPVDIQGPFKTRQQAESFARKLMRSRPHARF